MNKIDCKFNGPEANFSTTVRAMVGSSTRVEEEVVISILDDALSITMTSVSEVFYLHTKTLKSFAALGIIVGIAALAATALALAIIFCPVGVASIAFAVGMTLPGLSLTAFIGCAVGGGLLSLAGFAIGSRAVHLLRKEDSYTLASLIENG